MLPSPSDLQYFLEVAERGNLSRAAERIGITQPALSLSMRRLEDAIGLPLLVRSKSGVSLTRAGAKLAAEAGPLLRQWERVRDTAREEETAVRGRLRVGCHVSVALYTLKDFIPQLLSDNLGLEIQFTHDLSRRIAESVISGDLDFGLVINPVSHPDLRIQNLLTDEVTLFQSKKRRLPGCESTLFLDPDLHQSQKVLSRLARHGKPLRLVSTSSLEVIAELTKQGCGLGLLPSRVALPQGLEPLSDSAPRVKDTLALIYRPERQRSGASTAFKQAVVGALAAR